MAITFSDVVTTKDEIRSVLGEPRQNALDKVIGALDVHCRAFIAASPFVLIATSDGMGNLDVSPKGDPAGFVHVLDDTMLAIPDRVGNRRADTMLNIVETGRVGLLFLAPGKSETLRVNGHAQIVRDLWLREQLAERGKMPDFAMIVTVEEAFVHCAKCMIRSNLWQPEAWPDVAELPSIARMMLDQARPSESLEELEAAVEESYRDRLY
ncbi:MAG: pyridoxamine 5'-phosphate oxidase family protein [Caldilineaceae bacterium]|nr:pyridoxamine 5'-phosphate oxidase family protein [Caldilineaceae bacterium]